ncbi:hypothetical protein SRRS_07360 [Sporomusa rhizae]|uniref:hypothetical protein n=1 Tax=Sporomusa rhizae TaxID=357999 RepID=UPI00352AA714
MNKEQIKSKVNETGKKVDNWAEDTAIKHNYPKWKIYLGVVIGILAVIGLCYLAGWM